MQTAKEIMQDYDYEYFRNTAQGEARHRKYKSFKLGKGEAYDNERASTARYSLRPLTVCLTESGMSMALYQLKKAGISDKEQNRPRVKEGGP
jgi:hypothetical protein